MGALYRNKAPIPDSSIRPEGIFALNQPIEIQVKYQHNQSGVFQHLQPGFTLRFRDLLTMMIIVSDNTSTGTIVDMLGLEKINHFCRSVGMKNTIHRYGIPPQIERDHSLADVTVTTPKDQSLLLDLILKGIEDPTAAEQMGCTPSLCRMALEILGRQKLNSRLPALLPMETVVAHKTGTGQQWRNNNDVGIIFCKDRILFILAVFTEHVPLEMPDGKAPAFTISPAIQDSLKRLLADPVVAQGMEFLKNDQPQRIKETVEIVKIPSSLFGEAERAEDFARRLKALGLEDVRIDSEGNVIGRMSASPQIPPTLVISAHLDTVFPKGYTPEVTIDGKGVIHAPGIADDTAGLSALLSLVRAFKETGIRTVGDVLFVGTVGEEGRGDLRGVKKLFSTIPGIDGFISIDGRGADRIAYQALGSKRFEFVFTGAGGHSFEAFGKVANPLPWDGRSARSPKYAFRQSPGPPLPFPPWLAVRRSMRFLHGW